MALPFLRTQPYPTRRVARIQTALIFDPPPHPDPSLFPPSHPPLRTNQLTHTASSQLQTLCQAIFDAILVHIVNTISPSGKRVAAPARRAKTRPNFPVDSTLAGGGRYQTCPSAAAPLSGFDLRLATLNGTESLNGTDFSNIIVLTLCATTTCPRIHGNIIDHDATRTPNTWY